MIHADDTVDVYYFTNHDNISQIRGSVTEVSDVGLGIVATVDGGESFFPWTAVQRIKLVA